jgi:phosphatidylserine synthase
VFLHDHLAIGVNWNRTADVISWLLPLTTLALALLMVSRVTYVHFLSSVLRRRPLGHVIWALFTIALVVRYTALTVTVAAWVFVLSGPVRELWLRSRFRASPTGGSGMAAAPTIPYNPPRNE